MRTFKTFFSVVILATLCSLSSTCVASPIEIFEDCTPQGLCSADNTSEILGVEINGVTWAIYNVGATGTFVANVEDYGGLYQWNRKDTVNFLLNDAYYESGFSTATSWMPANNPCPTGWRVPTFNELKTLLDTEKIINEWTTEKGIKGRRFTDKTSGNSIFIPAAGYRDSSDGAFKTVGIHGYSWSSNENEYAAIGAYYLVFANGSVNWGNIYKAYGFPVRCVKSEP